MRDGKLLGTILGLSLLFGVGCGGEDGAGGDGGAGGSVDETAPTVAIRLLGGGDVRTTTRVWIEGEVEDDVGVETLRWSVGGGEPTAIEPAASFSFPVDLLPGRHRVRVEAIDAAGNRAQAEQVVTVENLLAGGADHSCAWRDGKVFGWGDAEDGQLGPSGDSRDVPDLVPELRGLRWMECGANSGLGAHHDGGLLIWGEFGGGEMRRLAGVEGAIAGAIGNGHFLILLESGEVMAAGRNDVGQLGLGDTEARAVPEKVPGLERIVKVVAGTAISGALRDDGAVFVWGSNQKGALGNGETDLDPHPTPQQIATIDDAIDIAAGWGHFLTVSRDGRIHGWGLGESGEVGHGSSGMLGNRAQPVEITGPSRGRMVFAHWQSSYAIDEDGRLWAWGRNSYGNLGIGDTSERQAPVLVEALERVRFVGAGMHHALALDEEGRLWAWGQNDEGQLGDGEKGSNRSLPTEVTLP